jgi:hypothetical protein
MPACAVSVFLFSTFRTNSANFCQERFRAAFRTSSLRRETFLGRSHSSMHPIPRSYFSFHLQGIGGRQRKASNTRALARVSGPQAQARVRIASLARASWSSRTAAIIAMSEFSLLTACRPESKVSSCAQFAQTHRGKRRKGALRHTDTHEERTHITRETRTRRSHKHITEPTPTPD